MSAVAVLARVPLARLARAPRAWLPVAAWFALGAVSAVVFARAGGDGASDALDGVFAPLALPLVVYAVVGATLGGDGLARASRSLVAFGAAPSRVAVATIAVAVGTGALVAAALGALVVALAHRSGDPPLARDLAITIWVAALAGAAYAALFALGATFGKRGGGRAAVLVLDWLFGSSDGVAGLLTPRAHARSLLGGPAVAELSGRWSALALVALVALFTALAVRRAARAA
jgi:hypothetical protein